MAHRPRNPPTHLPLTHNLDTLSLGPDITIDGHPGERFRGIEQMKSLKSLTVSSRVGNDHECRWIGHCKSLENLNLNGTFSNVGLARLTPMPDLEKLYLRGAVTVTEEGLAVLGRNPKLVRATITDTDTGGNREKNVYSELITREHEIGFAGGCSCGCMDTERPEALVLKRDQFTIQDDRLVIHPDVLAPLDLTRDETDESWGGKLRIAAPVHRKHLQIHRGDLPKRLTHLYLNDVQVDRLDLVDCLKEEIGVFDNSRVASLHIYESRDYDRYRDPGHPCVGIPLYLGDVRELTIHSTRTLAGLSVYGCRTLQSLHLEGSFPRLTGLFVAEGPQLQYLAAPYSGSASKLQISFRTTKRLSRLRLLKAPGVPNPGIGALLSDSHSHPPLREVDVRRSGIEDKYLDLLAEVPTLRILRIADCEDLTPQGIARFKSARPEVAVVQTE